MGTQIFDSQIKDNITLTGTPTAPTPSVSDDSTRIATTEFVHNVFGEFYPTGVTPTYVDSTHFTVSGDLTAIFTQDRVLKITDTGGTFNAICATSAYDSGTELTTVTVAGDTLDSGISAVLYAVQQVTGQIWESGSNANGTYVKFADGMMICYNYVSIASSNNSGTSFTLPATYANTTYAVIASPRTMISGGNSASYVTETSVENMSVIKLKCLYVTSGSVSDSPNSPVHYQTIGRWY